MAAETVIPARKALRSLWNRAPIWRAALVGAGVLTALFVLFPPEGHNYSLPEIPAQASYMQPSSVANNDLKSARSSFPPIAAEHPNVPTKPMTQKEEGAPTDASMFGQTYGGLVPVNGFKLPLPEGKWAMIVSTNITFPTGSGTSYFFARIKNKRLVEAIIVYALRAKSESDSVAGALSSSGCERTNTLYMSHEDSSSSSLPSCWYEYNYFTADLQRWADKTVRLGVLERAAAERLAAKGVTLPLDLVAVQFVRTEQWGLLYSNYLYNPESAGLESEAAPSFADSDWFYKNISRFPEKVAYAEKLKTWATSFWPQYQNAFASGR